MSAIQVFLLYINHSEISWYIKQCPLLGKGPLLGVSVNTVIVSRRWFKLSSELAFTLYCSVCRCILFQMYVGR